MLKLPKRLSSWSSPGRRERLGRSNQPCRILCCCISRAIYWEDAHHTFSGTSEPLIIRGTLPDLGQTLFSCWRWWSLMFFPDEGRIAEGRFARNRGSSGRLHVHGRLFCFINDMFYTPPSWLLHAGVPSVMLARTEAYLRGMGAKEAFSDVGSGMW